MLFHAGRVEYKKDVVGEMSLDSHGPDGKDGREELPAAKLSIQQASVRCFDRWCGRFRHLRGSSPRRSRRGPPQLGTLDATDPKKPTVVIPNYMTSHANWMESSGFYSFCCFEDCEGFRSARCRCPSILLGR